MKRSTRVDAAKSSPAVAERAQAATDKIIPLAQSAAALAVPLAQSAAAKAVPFAQGVAATAVPLAQTAAGRVAPLAGQAVTFAAPYAQQAVDAVTPYAQQAADAVSPYAQTVAGVVGPYAHSVADRAGSAAERLAPLAAGGALAAHEVAERIGPAVESVRDRVSDELLPRVSTALTAAATSPIAVEASKRGRAAYAAARGELSLPEVEEQKTGGSWLKRFAVVAAVAGIVALVARRFLGGSKDSGWQAARPSAPYTPATSAPSTPPSTADADAAAVATEDLSSVGVTDSPEPADLSAETTPDVAVATDVADVPEVAETAVAETPVAETASPYGPGSYVGSEPPEGFAIKGNENSMKFHLPGGRGYNQTIAEVWFETEEAAEAAGFVRAQH